MYFLIYIGIGCVLALVNDRIRKPHRPYVPTAKYLLAIAIWPIMLVALVVMIAVDVRRKLAE